MNGWTIRARRVIADHDPYLASHFPGATIYPGALVIESLRQAVSEELGADCDILSAHSARLMPLMSGDVLVLHAAAASRGDGTLAVTASASIEDSDIPGAELHMLLRVPAAVGAVAA